MLWGEPQFNQNSEPHQNTWYPPQKSKMLWFFFVPRAFKTSLHSSRQICAEYEIRLCSRAMESLEEEGENCRVSFLIWVTFRIRVSKLDATGGHFFTIMTSCSSVQEMRWDRVLQPNLWYLQHSNLEHMHKIWKVHKNWQKDILEGTTGSAIVWGKANLQLTRQRASSNT